MTNDLDDDFLQFLFNRLNEGYSEYKRNHPQFKEFVERELEGKKDDHCSFCGEWLPYKVDLCPECGRINN